jgi:toxin CptA
MLSVTIKSSRYLAAGLLAVHATAVATIVPLDIPSAAKAVLIALVIASLARSLRRHAYLKARAAIIGVEIKDRETAATRSRDGTWREADVLGTSYVSPFLTVLNLRVRGLRLSRHVVIVPDNIEKEDFRQLRVMLRWGQPKRF